MVCMCVCVFVCVYTHYIYNGILVIQKNEVLYIKYISDKDLPYSTGNLKVKVLVTPWCPTFCDSMDCSPRGSPVHGILQARVLEGETILFFRGSSQQSKLDLPHCRKILYHLSHQGIIIYNRE